MHPHQPAVPGMPTEPLPIAQANPGMSVVDAAGEAVGTVSAVQQPGTDVRPDAPPGEAERLMATGYLRVDVAGLMAGDAYVGGDQVADVSEADPGVVTLPVLREALVRAN
ncbi:hypothetical protein [Plantactinospora sp. KLBMP9567]|uniref:hypothetical protein n=1 Tax=Plantactinospora sp. KLBMP9567 TaxID=3085900 RepID=UPI002982ABF0|nr:hypothetical protein [Plantactinospora sp. KLBMP9567]MDW5322334.1 hypothetical protein [Plantactinospora sp. KLBMP9567]